MIARLFAAAALFAATPAMPQAKPPELPRLMTARTVMALPAPRPAETVRYGEGESQFVELYLPKPDPDAPDVRRPVVVLIHGGCWQKSVAGIELLRPAAAAFAERGYAVWAIGYRRVDEEGGGWPGTYQDVGTALDLIRDQAEAHRLDPGRVVLYGHSAGAHLALWAAGRHKLPEGSAVMAADPLRPRGVVSVGGLGNLKDWEREIGLACGDGIVAKITPPVEDDARFAEASPAALLPTGVPVVMLHGVFDDVATPAMGLDYAQLARRAGDRADIQVAPVSGHFEVIAPGTPAFAQAMAAVERFAR